MRRRIPGELHLVVRWNDPNFESVAGKNDFSISRSWCTNQQLALLRNGAAKKWEPRAAQSLSVVEFNAHLPFSSPNGLRDSYSLGSRFSQASGGGVPGSNHCGSVLPLLEINCLSENPTVLRFIS